MANNPNPNSGGKPSSMKDRLIQVEVKLDTILVNERTIYDEMMKLKAAMEKIATVVSQHDQVLAQIVGGVAPQATQAVPSPSTPTAQAPPAQSSQSDLSAALSIIGPVLQYLTQNKKGDSVTDQLVGAALQSAVETLKAGPLLVQAIASSLGNSFGKAYGREAGYEMAKNLGNTVVATAATAEAIQEASKNVLPK